MKSNITSDKEIEPDEHQPPTPNNVKYSRNESDLGLIPEDQPLFIANMGDNDDKNENSRFHNRNPSVGGETAID